jgi:hypothetical protein
MLLWSQMGETCMMALEAHYWDLVLLFKINVILLSISFFVFLCIICLGAAFLGGAVATGRLGGGEAPVSVRSLFFWRREQAGGGGGAGHGGGTNLDKALRTASMQGEMGDVDRLLREGASVSTKDSSNGWCALHYAAARLY